jgi:glutathione synthase/RimK-type ligase-like ATP-grasp enzyme
MDVQNRIKTVEAHSDFGCMVCETVVFSREDIISNMKNGVTFTTVFKTAMGKWRKGDDVHLVTVNTQDYLRTDDQCIAQDQFDNVPEI